MKGQRETLEVITEHNNTLNFLKSISKKSVGMVRKFHTKSILLVKGKSNCDFTLLSLFCTAFSCSQIATHLKKQNKTK
jgi:hypothetical protein